ncbi:MAG: hypothetical protein ACP5JP_07840, partial [bacterium]
EEYLYLTRGYHSLHKLPYFANAFFGSMETLITAVGNSVSHGCSILWCYHHLYHFCSFKDTDEQFIITVGRITNQPCVVLPTPF